MKIQAFLRDFLLVSVIFFIVVGLFAGPPVYREIGQTMGEDMGSVAHFINTILEEQEKLLTSITNSLNEGSGMEAPRNVGKETETILSDYEKASHRMLEIVLKWTTIFIVTIIALICILAIVRFIVWSPRTQF